MPHDPSVGMVFAGLSPRLSALTGRGFALGLTLRDPGESARCLDEVVTVASKTGFLELEIYALSCLSLLSTLRGDYDAAEQRARIMAERAATAGAGIVRAWASLEMGRVQLAKGELVPAVDTLKEALSTAEQTRTSGFLLGSVLGCVAETLLALGNVESVLRKAEEPVAFERSHGLAWDLASRFAWSRALIASGDRTAALQALGETEQCVAETDARIYQPYWHECRAEFEEHFGDPSRRREELREAHRLFSEMGGTGHAERIARELADPA